MKIAIFGDSFADPTWATNNYLAWPELLSREYDIENFALSGTSFWWSYSLYLQNKKDFDYCIFVVTLPGRIYLESLDKHMNIHPGTWPIKHDISLGELYYRYFYSESRENLFHSLMLNELLKNDNILIIPAFAESFPDNRWSLCHYSDLEIRHYNLKKSGDDDQRKCHLSIKNNQMIYEKIKESLLKEDKVLELREEYYVEPTENVEYYWNWSN